MKSKLSRILLVFLTAILLSACSPQQPEVTQTPTQTIKPTLKPTPSILSKTTGLPIPNEREYKPVAVMIENSPACRPQTGLQAADVVYEAPVEGCTRFMCIYNDNLPEKVGPVRSARIYFIKAQQEWDSAYVHFGGASSGQANVYGSSSSHINTRIDFIKGNYNSYYWRSREKSSPHNVFTNVEKCQSLMKEESTGRTLTFDQDKVYEGKSITEVTLPFYSGEVTYKYDSKKDKLIRYMNGKEFIDAATDSAVEVQNLVVQYHKFYHGNELYGRWLCDQLGSGKADFFIGGVHIEGTWSRKSYDSPTIYKDSEGNEIVLKRAIHGLHYIQIKILVLHMIQNNN